ncbi:MAG: SCO family protein [Pseudomonadota bacterium]
MNVTARERARSASARIAAAFLLGALSGVSTASAHGTGDHAKADAPAAARVQLEDTLLLDRYGVERRLKSDVLGDRVAVVNFVYTTCTTVCPVTSATFAQLQERLGARLGTQVRLVSITVDPQRDTPARLRAYAAKHDAGMHWTWLTGRKDAVDAALKGFGAYTPNPQDHPAIVMIGDARSGQWTRLYGFPAVAEILAEVDRRIAERAAAAR